MKTGHYFVVLLLAVVCAVLTVALILMTHTNQQLQVQLQSQQQALNQGILGQQAQQISGGVLQDLADSAVGNPKIRQLLEKYGYRVASPRSPSSLRSRSYFGGVGGSTLNVPENKREESTNTEAPKP